MDDLKELQGCQECWVSCGCDHSDVNCERCGGQLEHHQPTVSEQEVDNSCHVDAKGRGGSCDTLWHKANSSGKKHSESIACTRGIAPYIGP
jgi:hypothetical protein